MAIKVRRLNASEFPLLLELLASQKGNQDLVLWQDRSPAMSEIFRPVLCGEPLYFGAFFNDKLVGCSGILPMELNNGQVGWLDTDLFVHPQYRGTPVAAELVEYRYIENLKSGPRFYFGIEENPRQLNLAARLSRRYKMKFEFIGESILRHEYLTSAPRNVDLQKEIEIRALCDLSGQDIEKWFMSQLKISPLVPKITREVISKLADLDPQAVALRNKGGAALVLLSQSKARKFRSTGKENLILTKLGRAKGRPFQRDEELSLGILGLLSEGASLLPFAPAIEQLARQRGFDGLVYRDMVGADEPGIWSQDTFSFMRRVFVIYSEEIPDVRSLFSIYGAPCPLLDSLFL